MEKLGLTNLKLERNAPAAHSAVHAASEAARKQGA
jgi:hypothetical protein